MSNLIKKGAKSKKTFQEQPPLQSEVSKEQTFVYESPRKNTHLCGSDLRPTTIAKSPYSKVIDELEFFPLNTSCLLGTPRDGGGEEMMFLRTPDHRILKVEGAISIQKLDFDEDIINSSRYMETIKSMSSDEYESVEEGQEELSEQMEKQNVSIQQEFSAKFQEQEINEDLQQIQERVMARHNPQQPHNSKACCNCKKSKCIKLYCDCFRSSKLCTNCSCGDCLNQNENCEERYKAIALVLEVNPTAFSPKIKLQKHTKGCNCKKSGCHKRYCQCYQAGLGCSDLCKCTQCKNIGGDCKDKKKHSSIQIGKTFDRFNPKPRNHPPQKSTKAQNKQKLQLIMGQL